MNFVVTASGADAARQIAEAAESYRRDLAIEWLGRELPAWRQPCIISTQVDSDLSAGGRTSFEFKGGTAVGWEMMVKGSRKSILDAVLPHEVAHAVFATHFGTPLPRWIEEGACMSVERGKPRQQIDQLFRKILVAKQVMPVDHLFIIRKYPSNAMPMYAQAHSLTQFLLQLGGKRDLMRYFEATLEADDWQSVLLVHYGFADLSEFESAWLKWAANNAKLKRNRTPITTGE